jgi:hypothetical protein
LRIQIPKISPALESKVIERIQVLLDREGSYLADAYVLLAVSLDENSSRTRPRPRGEALPPVNDESRDSTLREELYS